MRFLNLLFCVLFAVTAFSFDLSSLVELGKIKNDPVEKSLIETILMSLEKSQGGKIENIQALVEDLFVKLIYDQKANDMTWGKERTRLDNRIRDLQLQITKLYTEFRNLEKKKQASNPEILDQLPILLNIKFNYLLILIL